MTFMTVFRQQQKKRKKEFLLLSQSTYQQKTSNLFFLSLKHTLIVSAYSMPLVSPLLSLSLPRSISFDVSIKTFFAKLPLNILSASI